MPFPSHLDDDARGKVLHCKDRFLKNAVQVVPSQKRAPAGGGEGGERQQHRQPAGGWPDSLESSALFLSPPTSFLPFSPSPPSLPQRSSCEEQRTRALREAARKPRAVRAASGSSERGSPGSTSLRSRPRLPRSLAPARSPPPPPSRRRRKAAGAQDGFSRALRPARLLLGAGGGDGHGRRRRRPIQGAGVQAQEHHGVGAALPARERPEHHAQPLGLRTQAPLLGAQRLPRRDGRGGRPGKHRAALLRAGWVPGEVVAARRPYPPPRLAPHTHSPPTSPPPLLPPWIRPTPNLPPHPPAGGCLRAPDFSPHPKWMLGHRPLSRPRCPTGAGCRSLSETFPGLDLPAFLQKHIDRALVCDRPNSHKPSPHCLATCFVLCFTTPPPRHPLAQCFPGELGTGMPAPWQACAGHTAPLDLQPALLERALYLSLGTGTLYGLPAQHSSFLSSWCPAYLHTYMQQCPHPATSTCLGHTTMPWIKKSSNCSLFMLVSPLFPTLPKVGKGFPAHRMVFLAKRLPLPSFICLHFSLFQYPSINFLRPQNSFRSWNLLIHLSHCQSAKILWFCSSTLQSRTGSCDFVNQNVSHFAWCIGISLPPVQVHHAIHSLVML